MWILSPFELPPKVRFYRVAYNRCQLAALFDPYNRCIYQVSHLARLTDSLSLSLVLLKFLEHAITEQNQVRFDSILTSLQYWKSFWKANTHFIQKKPI